MALGTAHIWLCHLGPSLTAQSSKLAVPAAASSAMPLRRTGGSQSPELRIISPSFQIWVRYLLWHVCKTSAFLYGKHIGSVCMDSVSSGSGLCSIIWGGNLPGLWFGAVVISVFNKNERKKNKTELVAMFCFLSLPPSVNFREQNPSSQCHHS